MKHIIVIHNFWMESKNFETISFEGSFKKAEKQAKALCFDRQSTFNQCAYTIVTLPEEIED